MKHNRANTSRVGALGDHGRWSVGDAEFNASTLELIVNGQPAAVERLPLELLRFLLQHPDKVLDKTTLHEHLWPGRIVSETVLPRCVTKLRKALGDHEQTLIRTVHGYGYRLLAPVTQLDSEVPPSAAMGNSPPRRPQWKLQRRFKTNPLVWLAANINTGEQRLYRFAASAEEIEALREEIDLMGYWKQPLPGFGNSHRALDWNTEVAPFYLETECHADGVGDSAVVSVTAPLARVFLIEDQDETRARLATAVTAADDLELVGAVGSCAEALATFSATDVDVVLVDLGLPDGNGIDLIRRLRRVQPEALFMVITVFGDERHVVQAIEAGAVAYLLKDTTASGVARNIRALCNGGSPISPAVARFLLQGRAPRSVELASMPAHESDILQWVAQGYTEDEIAQRSGRDAAEVHRQIRDIYCRLAELAPATAGNADGWR